MAKGTVRSVSNHVEELADGRMIFPGCTAEVPDLDDAHIAGRVADGVFRVEGSEAEPAKAHRASKETA